MNHPQLELFKFDSCPFCQMVMSKIKQTNIKVIYKDINEDQSNLERLMKDTGRRTVPCLYVDNSPMFESRDIISWIDSYIDTLEKNS